MEREAQAARLPGTEACRAVVVGGSLAGLMTGLALARSGIDVTLLERVGSFPRSGASLGGVDERLLMRLTGGAFPPPGSVAGRSVTSGIQPWDFLHQRLRAAAEADERITVHHRTRVIRVGQDPDAAWAVTEDGRTYRGEVVIGADGHRSTVRAAVAPDKPDAAFAGYLIWLGVADESALAPGHRYPRDFDILHGGEDVLLGYPLASRRGSIRPGSRRMGWAWYDASRTDLLRQTGSVRGTVVQHSLRAADIPETTFKELMAEAADLWPAPWRDAILDSLERSDILGTPIAEYVPELLINGRVALVGDAAHVPTPMTGSGFAAAMKDAEAVAEALASGLRHGTPLPQALAVYERKRLPQVRSMVQSGQQFSRSFAGQLV
ncbi:FAD-dependent monooxygenase [Streptomyces sp. NBC_01166]|uniref:FAD-dependent monooxygenase n=1 Tax=Streptomyces sp. NBC_01166 TaxID=2903755 RepID=UPI003863C6AB|nr:FAD-dependent monooxygenase [Streptomyces sp. NBC_01166]